MIITEPEYISCRFGKGSVSILTPDKYYLNIFYGETNDFIPKYTEISSCLSDGERARADRFLIEKDRQTWIVCHSLLRIFIADYLQSDPGSLSFGTNQFKKPLIKGNPVYFNLSHTRDAFIFSISEYFPVGVDLESYRQDIQLRSIANNYFSKRECDFIFCEKEGQNERFFLVWTRKEALLKAIGVGIIDYLPDIEVSEIENDIDINILRKSGVANDVSDIYLYSGMTETYCFSIAIPVKVGLKLNFMGMNDIDLIPYTNC